MQIEQSQWSSSSGTWTDGSPSPLRNAQLVLVFGGRTTLEQDAPLADLRQAYPEAVLFGCSTAGEIQGTCVDDETLAVTAITFSSAHVVAHEVRQDSDSCGPRELGARLAEKFPPQDLKHLLVLSDGVNVNGSELLHGLTDRLPGSVTISGGLSGDGENFGETLVLCGEQLRSGMVAAIGFYGESLDLGSASFGGWSAFGSEREITRADQNILYELDGQSALGLYRKYLGPEAGDLPASGLRFPLAVRTTDQDLPLVRTVLSIDEETQSMVFAGDMPVGGKAQLMMASYDRLIDGAGSAARASLGTSPEPGTELAILISCVGRRMVLGQRVEEELEAVSEALGSGVALSGFYSYGELSPFTPSARCEFHNQTMTVTVLREAA